MPCSVNQISKLRYSTLVGVRRFFPGLLSEFYQVLLKSSEGAVLTMPGSSRLFQEARWIPNTFRNELDALRFSSCLLPGFLCLRLKKPVLTVWIHASFHPNSVYIWESVEHNWSWARVLVSGGNYHRSTREGALIVIWAVICNPYFWQTWR